MNKFINILQFLTRITIKKDIPYEKNMGSGLIFFPVVGIIIGGGLLAEYLALDTFVSPKYSIIVIPFILVVSEIIITGGLHVDGFGDTFDGLFSYRDKDGILEIMKDPRLGTNGVLSVVFLVLSKIIIIFILIDRDILWPIFLMPMIGRYVCVVLSYKSHPARENGMGNMFIGKCDIGTLLASSAFTALVVTVASAIFSKSFIQAILDIVIVGVMFILTNVFEYLVSKKIGGLTGDILGCGIELGELVFLLCTLLVTI